MGNVKGVGWCTLDTRGGFGLGFWKEILTCWSCVSSNLSFEVGNGQRIKFGRMLGWRIPLYKSLSLCCLPWLSQRRHDEGILEQCNW